MSNKLKICYIAGLNASQKGAIGTHTSGVIQALDKRGDIELTTIHIQEEVPIFISQNALSYKIKIPAGKIKKIFFIYQYAKYINRIINKIRFDYIYIRFDPLLAPLVVNKVSILEYNDIFLDQIKFSIKKKTGLYLVGF